ncbi:MAG: tetraacyldisaccharide 4'-kinase [Verrucomicrobiales bacterium]|nr:tetraacyldisaccharide 4'-kinase [Verrucomicrobiales bacterium]MDC0066325.1 tetraacyldisaccharide 4'-kinase [Verrucomicrobiota bacterium]OUU88999.1 MAG: tetraacyldisaccharide 4'-kinase [Verrucomicrobiaceae bacterium TMED76]
MKESLEELEQFAIDVILNRRKGFRASVIRLLLSIMSIIYRFLVSLRLWLYKSRIKREHNLGCLVVSIGNLTVGGTGKTPIVEKFAKALTAGGRRVAILSRGYKSAKPSIKTKIKSKIQGNPISQEPPRVVTDGKEVFLDSETAGDEPYMLATNLEGVAIVVDKDRVKAGLHAIKEFDVDTLLLDDGLQYLRLKHRLDVVLIDKYSPFGNEKLLPRGTLREPPKNLKRASYIFITKCDGSSNEELIKRIRKYNRTAEIIECAHKPKYLENIDSGEKLPLEHLKGKDIGTVSGIAVPESFEDGLKNLGANVELTRRYTDHHRYRKREIQKFIDQCLNRDLDMIVTTEKDYVRFPDVDLNENMPIFFLRVEIGILSNEETFEDCINRICSPRPILSARRFF